MVVAIVLWRVKMPRKSFQDKHGVPASAFRIKLGRIKTIDDLFTRSDVNELLEKVIKEKSDICNLVIMWKNSKGIVEYLVTDNPQTEIVGLIEFTKNMILNPDDKDVE